MNKKIKPMIICLFFILCLSVLSFSEETLTITTYYPSPYGSYRELSAYRMKIGQNYSTQDVADNNLVVEGNVSIGTTGPEGKLHVAGIGAQDAKIFLTSSGTDSWPEIRFRNDATTWRLFAPDGSQNDIFLIDAPGTPAFNDFVISTIGRVGIGTTSPNGVLEVVGNVTDTFRISNTIRPTAGLRITPWNAANDVNIIPITSGATLHIGRTGETTWGNVVVESGRVGIGTTSPAGTLDVNGAIFQRGSELYADYVFAPGYELETIEKHAEYMWQNKRLKAVPMAQINSTGQQMLEIGAHSKGILEELEKAHIYIQQLDERIKILEKQCS